MIAYRAAALAAVFFVLSPASAQSQMQSPAQAGTGKKSVIDFLALMSGSCETFRIAGRQFTCNTVAYAHDDQGRVNFAVVIDDPEDSSRIISFSGENGKRADDNSYELVVDRMMLNSKDRPRVDGLPVPTEHQASGRCRQTGNLAAKRVSNIKCSAMDSDGRSYELQFVSDGSPAAVRRIRQSAPSIQNPFE